MLFCGCDTNILTWFIFIFLGFFLIFKMWHRRSYRILTVCSPSPIKRHSIIIWLSVLVSSWAILRKTRDQWHSQFLLVKALLIQFCPIELNLFWLFGKPIKKLKGKETVSSNSEHWEAQNHLGDNLRAYKTPAFCLSLQIWDEISRTKYFHVYVSSFCFVFFFLMCSWKAVFMCQLNSSFPSSCSSCLCTNITDYFLFQLFVQEWNPVNWQASI